MENQISEHVQNSPAWREKDGVIYFSVTSNGLTGAEWIEFFESKDTEIGFLVKSLLLNKAFTPTNGTIFHIAVLKASLFPDQNRSTSKICAEAANRRLRSPNAEVACLIRATFSDKEFRDMGLSWLSVMHKYIDDADGDPSLLGIGENDDRRWLLYACCDGPESEWAKDGGFAFLAP